MMSNTPDITIIDNFLSEVQFQSVLNDTNSSEEVWALEFNKYPQELKETSTYWESMSINVGTQDYAKEAGLDFFIYSSIINKMKKEVEKKYNKIVRLESCLLSRWRVGRDQEPHIDFYIDEEEHDVQKLLDNGVTIEGARKFGKNFSKKHFSSLVYLNNNFKGGDLYFPQYDNFTLRPKPNMAVIFSGDENNFHGVTMVTEGIRYTISMFWTDINREKGIK